MDNKVIKRGIFLGLLTGLVLTEFVFIFSDMLGDVFIIISPLILPFSIAIIVFLLRITNYQIRDWSLVKKNIIILTAFNIGPFLILLRCQFESCEPLVILPFIISTFVAFIFIILAYIYNYIDEKRGSVDEDSNINKSKKDLDKTSNNSRWGKFFVLLAVFFFFIIYLFVMQGLLFLENKLAVKTENEIFCKMIFRSQLQDDCYKDVAILKGDINLCHNIQSSETIRDKCYLEVAKQTGDIYICDEFIKLDFWKSSCYHEVAIKNQNLEFCDKLEPYKKGYCYQKMAVLLEDESICRKNNIGSHRSVCFYAMAKLKDNPNLCEEIPDYDSFSTRTHCYKQF